MTAYYNEYDPKAAAWLRELIKAGHIAHGEVDERSINDVTPNDLRGFTQCHFFAGIGGWSYALRLAQWPDDRPVWTGSCPCQPFSAAGKRGGFADERHLWPVWHWLIAQCRPPVIFGEQVANALEWLDLVQGDMEAEDYAVGAAIIGAHSVGAPHIRQRLYWGAITESEQHDRRRDARTGRGEPTDGSSLVNADEQGPQGRVEHWDGADEWLAGSPSVDSMADTSSGGCAQGSLEGPRQALCTGARRTDADGSNWGNPDWLPCTDGKWRPVEPGTFPLAHGIPARVGLLRGYGNAIVPQVAAEFIKVCM